MSRSTTSPRSVPPEKTVRRRRATPSTGRRALLLPLVCASALLVATPAVATGGDGNGPAYGHGNGNGNGHGNGNGNGNGNGPNQDEAYQEAEAILESRDGEERQDQSDEDNVFFPSTLGLYNLEDNATASVDLPLFPGLGPDGEGVWYILTEAADFDVAAQLGVNYAPKLAHGIDTGGDQPVTIEDGKLRFTGAIDFSPRRVLTPGTGASAFPPAIAEPGGIGDENWSGLVVLPSGSALNVMVVANATGFHDRAQMLDYEAGVVNYSLADGFEGGDQFYYHLVTESSDAVAATVEQGVFSPRLGALPAAGESDLEDDSARLGFAPTANGETGYDNPERQGLNSTVADDDLPPINVFPLDPANDQRENNNYSPMWDAHVYVWTEEAIAAGERRRVNGLEDLQAFKDAGLVVDAPGNAGPENDLIAGLRPTGIIINCPVINQPFEGTVDLPVGPLG